MDLTYTIKQGDCLSLIAEKFGIDDLSVLQDLNSDLIKDIDWIYAGDTLRLPGNEAAPHELDTGTRIALPKVPQEAAGPNDLCSGSSPDFVDILYVPAHPKTGKRVCYALTQQAQDAVKQELATMAQVASAPDHTALMRQVSQLGLLSKFETTSHERFLSEPQVTRLRKLTWMQATLSSGAAKQYAHGGEYGFVTAIAEQEGLDVDNLLDNELSWLQFKQFIFTGIVGGLAGASKALYDQFSLTEQDQIDQQYNQMDKAKYGVRAEVVDYLATQIAELESIAIKASGHAVTDDGTKFVYDTERGYYTSEQQQILAQTVKMVNQLRPSDDELKNQDTETLQTQHQQFWAKVEKTCSILSTNDASNWQQDSPLLEVQDTVGFATHLMRLNSEGYVIKEQCLSFDELIGSEDKHFGPKRLNTNAKYQAWRTDTKLTIDVKDNPRQMIDGLIVDCYGERGRGRDGKIAADLINTGPIRFWAYYPTLAFVRFVDTTLTQWLGSITSIVGTSIPDLFEDLIWLKKLALGHIEALKARAQRCAINNLAVKHVYVSPEVKPNRFTLIWDEARFETLEKSPGLLKNEAGHANLQVVECSLLSTGGEVGWVRGPAWYLPSGQPDLSKGHVKDITGKVTFASPLASPGVIGKALPEVLAEMKKQVMTRRGPTKSWNLSQTIQQYQSSAFWTSNYHWDGDLTDGHSTYVADAQSQFFRFTSSAEGSLNLPLSEVKGLTFNLDVTSGVKSEAELSLARAQLTFNTVFPEQKLNPLYGPTQVNDFALTYIARQAGNSSRESYPIGGFAVQLDAKVYGLAAVSCQLSSNLAVGPSETDGGIGVKGKAIKVADPNQHVDDAPGAQVIDWANTDIPVAVQSDSSVDVFAGVEAGGVVNTEVFWRPPSVDINGVTHQQDILSFGRVCAQGAAVLGAGFSGELHLGFSNGQLFFACAAKTVFGPGVSGKVSIALNPTNVDRFVECLLGVLKESGFQYVECFGARDKNGVNPDFVALNERLTLAVALGISVGDVLLLPEVEYASYQKRVTQEDFAPFIARHINGEQSYPDKLTRERELEKRKRWIRSLPPETLANLLNCLTCIVDKPLFGESHHETQSRLRNEQAKALAIINIFTWLQPKPSSELDYRCLQFEKALICMGGPLEQAKSPKLQWLRFAQSWAQIEHYMVRIQNIQYELQDLNNAVAILGQYMQGYRYVDANRQAHYHCYRRGLSSDTEQIKATRTLVKGALDSDPRWAPLKQWKIG